MYFILNFEESCEKNSNFPTVLGQRAASPHEVVSLRACPRLRGERYNFLVRLIDVGSHLDNTEQKTNFFLIK